eukprot:495946_1
MNNINMNNINMNNINMNNINMNMNNIPPIHMNINGIHNMNNMNMNINRPNITNINSINIGNNNNKEDTISETTTHNSDQFQPKITMETTTNFLTNLPNLNNISSIKDLKNLNLTRLAMPIIKGRKRYQINNQNISPHFNDEDYKYHCDKCNAAFFYQQDVIKHKQYSECINRPYLCPFCERPFKSCLSVKKHCVNLHSSIINWDLVGKLLQFVTQHEEIKTNTSNKNNNNGKHNNNNIQLNYSKIVRKFARDFYLLQLQKQKEEKNNNNNDGNNHVMNDRSYTKKY